MPNSFLTCIKKYKVTKRDFFCQVKQTLGISHFRPRNKLSKEDIDIIGAFYHRNFPTNNIKITILSPKKGINTKCVISYNRIVSKPLHLYTVLSWGEEKCKKILTEVFKVYCKRFSNIPYSSQYKLVGFDCNTRLFSILDTTLNKVYKRKYNYWANDFKTIIDYTLSTDEKNKIRSIKGKKRLAKQIQSMYQEKLNLLSDKFTVPNDYQKKNGYVKTLYKNKSVIYISRDFFRGSFTQKKFASKSSFLLRTLIAGIRYNSLIPVTMTDEQYHRFVLKKTNGKFEAVGRFPSKRHNDTDFKFKCCRCGTIFKKYCSNLFDSLKCPQCDIAQSKRYSKQAISWLKDISNKFGIDIQTAESEQGEYKVQLGKGKSHFVDGYCKKYNIVFEYHGSRWHGNPTVYYMSDPVNPYDKKVTAYDLLKRTMRLEKQIINAGYSFIRIWDSDYLNKERYRQWLVQNTKRILLAIKK